MQIVNSTSPTSVRCKLDEGTKTGIASIKSLDTSNHSTESTDASTDSSSRSNISSTSTSSSSRRVRFLPLVRAKDTISRYDMTEDEITRCFLQDYEYDIIWEQNQRIVRRAKKYHSTGEPLPAKAFENKSLEGFELDIETKEKGEYLCTRGLETIARNYRRESIECVLEEQEFQEMEGFYDDELIAEIYAEANKRCKFKAVYLAMEDRLSACSESTDKNQ